MQFYLWRHYALGVYTFLLSKKLDWFQVEKKNLYSIEVAMKSEFARSKILYDPFREVLFFSYVLDFCKLFGGHVSNWNKWEELTCKVKCFAHKKKIFENFHFQYCRFSSEIIHWTLLMERLTRWIKHSIFNMNLTLHKGGREDVKLIFFTIKLSHVYNFTSSFQQKKKNNSANSFREP